MNKKGKHKKGKIPNPSPLQDDKEVPSGDKIEELGVTGDKKEDVAIVSDNTPSVEENVVCVTEERVPEIVSEVLKPPVDVKDEESPKKPKRYRGKKKKGGKDDDFEDNFEEKPKEADIQQPLEEAKDIPENENKTDELLPITPTARKKKNKKKNTDQKDEEPILPDQELTNILADVKPDQPEVTDIKKELIKAETLEPEIKLSKKKKNKKKRNDSERSDKEEVSCTSAFQKILDDKDEPEETKKEEQLEDNIVPLESVKAEVDKVESKLEIKKDTVSVQPVIERAHTPIKIGEDVKETAVVDGKGKKKNKKDKKNIPKPEESVKQQEKSVDQTSPLLTLETILPLVIPEQAQEVPTGVKEEVTKDVAIAEVPKSLEEDLSLKPKAKIAKLVEKKRKGKHVQESLPQDASIPELLKVEEVPMQITLESPEIKETEQDKPVDVESKATLHEMMTEIPLTPPDEDEKLIAQEFELLAEKAMGKKRKKASKMPKSLELEQNTVTDTKQIDAKEDIKEPLPVISEILTPQPEQQGFNIVTEKCDAPVTVGIETEIKETFKSPEQAEFKGKELLTPENVAEEKKFKTDETITQKTEDKQKTETKSGKKRKKSPKPPSKMDVAQVERRSITPNPEEIPKETSKSEEITKQSLSERIDASNITRMYDIEISSIKADDSEVAVSDAIPEITYPRATSQQLTDDNNNTVIREIFPVQEIIAVPLFTPEVKETLNKDTINKPIQPSVGIAPKEEKTDIKSKMMEVNQDMEELRLSIERSLAELTSIEKSEDSIEKQFEATRLKTEKVANILYDTKSSDADTKEIKQKATKMPSDDRGLIVVSEDISTDKPKVELTPQVSTAENKPVVDQSKTKTSRKQRKMEAAKAESKTENIIPFIDSQPTEIPTMIREKSVENKPADVSISAAKPLTEEQKVIERPKTPVPLLPVKEIKPEIIIVKEEDKETKPKEQVTEIPSDVPPVCPARKDQKGKNKKKKGKQETQTTATAQSTSSTSQSQTTQESKKEEKTEAKTEKKSDSKNKSETKEKGKQQSSNVDSVAQDEAFSDVDYEPIDNFEDALTSSVDDVNKTFEIIVKETQEQNNPKINIIAPDKEKTPVSPPKNLLSHHDIPVPSNRRDYKKEKDKIPNEITAKVKIKDSVEVERKQSKNTQTNNKMKDFSKNYKINDNEDFVYKYSFRKVFLQSSCHVCKKALSGSRVSCSYCNLLFYCSNKHKDEDWPQHQALCFAVSTLVHLKDQKHIYGDAKNLTGHDYRLIRMQMIVSCEKVLKRRLVPWEQEALLYPRMCAHVPCREWRQGKLRDCQDCGQISYCIDNAEHYPKTHARWCKSYSLYEKLVCYQQTKGRLEPKLPTRVLKEPQQIPEKINEVLASMYEEKIDMNDIQYAALTQLATAPLTAAYCHQVCKNKLASQANGVFKKSTFTIHVVGAELQFEADALNKWEVFFLHLRPDLQELRVVLINYNLNPSNLPLELLGKIKLCENCRQNKRRVVFDFQDKRTYADYKTSEDYVHPDIVCAFNPSIQRSSVYNGKDPWPTTINVILKLKVPFIITGYTITELHKDCIRIKECSETGYNFITEPKYNSFASVRPDRNFISDDEMPLLFKNYCFAIICG